MERYTTSATWCSYMFSATKYATVCNEERQIALSTYHHMAQTDGEKLLTVNLYGTVTMLEAFWQRMGKASFHCLSPFPILWTL